MKLLWLIAIVVAALAQFTLGYEDYGQGDAVNKEYCLAEPCESLRKCPLGFIEKEGGECVPEGCGCGGH